MAGKTDRVSENVAAIAETRQQMSDKLQELDQRWEQTVGGTWTATSMAQQAFGTIQQLVMIARVGATVLRFFRRHPVIILGAAIGTVMLLKQLGPHSHELPSPTPGNER